jgi:hypothetical protein
MVLDDGTKRLVLCALDLASFGGAAREETTLRLAEAAGTTPELVSIHCLHLHDAPSVGCKEDLQTEEARRRQHDWWNRVMTRLLREAEHAQHTLRPIAQIGVGEARVHQCASNRRLVGPTGSVVHHRWSKNNPPEVQAWPVGIIDPMLRTITCWDGENELVLTMSYYNSHPQSADGRGLLSGDSVGEALRLLRERYPSAAHMYFTGCGGDITYGKYSTSDLENNIRIFGARLADGMTRAIVQSQCARRAVNRFAWTTTTWLLPFCEIPYKDREVSAPLTGQLSRLSLLELGPARVLHGMGELFVAYQLYAQALRPDEFIAFATFGDPLQTYVPTAQAFSEGGYEVDTSHTTVDAEARLKEGIARLLA